MAVTKQISTASLQIEVGSGVDSSGNTVFRKKSFSNVRSDADLQNIYDVGQAIVGVLDAQTRNVLISESSKLISQ